MELERFEGSYVNIECFDGRAFDHWYVYAYSDKYDNPDKDEDSIDILKEEDDNSGVTLFSSEIKSIVFV